VFTGIVEDSGTVRSQEQQGVVVRLTVETALDLSDTRLGDSIAVNGVCLTVTRLDPGPPARVSFDVGPESLQVTSLSRAKPGGRVHLERALALGDRLGGHLVQGHVDGVGKVRSRREDGDTLQLRIDAPAEILRLCIHKGSICIDGVSLTINELFDDGFSVWLIPHTLERTRLADLAVGDVVNLENDLIGKYVERLVLQGRGPEGGVTWDLLEKSGFGSRDG
jgi:riboflavin synthase